MENCSLENLKGKNWLATMVLCWFLGSLGAHRFYTGKSTTAWIMLVMSLIGLTPISVVWSFVDGILIALGKYTHEDGSELYEKINWVGYVYIAQLILSVILTIALVVLFIGLMGAVGSAVGNTLNSGATGLTP